MYTYQSYDVLSDNSDHLKHLPLILAEIVVNREFGMPNVYRVQQDVVKDLTLYPNIHYFAVYMYSLLLVSIN